MEECEHCKINPDTKEGEACGDMWLEKTFFGWRLLATMGQSEVFYCPWCGRKLEGK